MNNTIHRDSAPRDSAHRSSTSGGPPATALLRLEEVALGFETPSGGMVSVLRGVSLEVRRGEILALVGESGCGKTLTALAILGLLPSGCHLLGGSIELAGAGDLVKMAESQRRRLRGRRLAMIFQDPSTALNPVLSIGFQIIEVLRLHRGLGRRAARHEAQRLLESVALADAGLRLRAYPHQLSGGQLQRVMIAMALATEPDLLLADEPTTALDVTVQAQVLDLLLDLKEDLGLTVLLITHDLGVVAECSDRVAVMYAGEIVEEAAVGDLFHHPQHPYTRGLLAAVPRLGREEPLTEIPGQVPEPGQIPSGCAFHPRCSEVMDRCRMRAPELYTVGGAEHRSRCFLGQGRADLPGGGTSAGTAEAGTGTAEAGTAAESGTR